MSRIYLRLADKIGMVFQNPLKIFSYHLMRFELLFKLATLRSPGSGCRNLSRERSCITVRIDRADLEVVRSVGFQVAIAE